MATLSKNILPIPESVVVGSGSYTVPANKYAFLSASTAASQGGVSSTNMASSSATTNTIEQWLSAGSSISTTSSAPSALTGGGLLANVSAANYTASATLQINGTTISAARAQGYLYATTSGSQTYYLTSASVGWCVSLFPIPVDNLPASLTT